ncbi:co-chaperone YbbN [Synechococcus sp. PCC 7335]|uniref:thioredoxin family protein n=1 Tax=Synechococcus sp. (strain ATCC 29403 / PCC 7335) TaxID=91464 RepID=UPI001D0D5410|nr:thioredoxin domain-containing protein [Synechococcus sp. PCC 7335]
MTMVTDENFNREVLASSVPVLVHFSAPWCGICRLVSPVLNSFRTEWPGPIQIVDINADQNLKLANRYQLTALPTLLYIEQGRVLQRIEGFRSREYLLAQLQGIKQRHCLESMFSRSA